MIIYHNPRCSKSRQALELLKENGEEPEVIEYLKNPLNESELGDLLKKLKMYNFFEYVAGSDTFSFNKPDPRHLTNVVEIIQGDLKKTLMVGDSEVDGKSAENANIPFILVKDGYTEKTSEEIKHDELIKDFKNFDKVIAKYL